MTAMFRTSLRTSLAIAVAVVGLAAGAAPAAPAAPPAGGPVELVTVTADKMFSALDANRAALKADPSKVEALVHDILLPTFDVDYSARLVLANNWRAATPDQQARFQKAFIAFLTRTYGKAVIDFERNRLKVLPLKGPIDPKRTFVPTEIARTTGAPIPVDYVLHQTPQGWKVFDIVIEGISYVLNYRKAFADEIDAEGHGDPVKGIEAVITRLDSGTFQTPGGPTTPAAPAKKAGA